MPFYPQLGIPLFSRHSCAGRAAPGLVLRRLALTIKLPGPSQSRLATKTAEGSGGKAVVGRRAEYVSRTLPSVRRITNSPNGLVEMWVSQVPKFLALPRGNSAAAGFLIFGKIANIEKFSRHAADSTRPQQCEIPVD
jgi:hypothetical protein